MRVRNKAGSAAIVAVAGMLALTGCTDGNGSTGGATAPAAQGSSSGPTSDTGPAPEASGTETAPAASTRTRVALTVIDTAEGAVSGGTVFDLENDTEKGKRIWEAKVADASGGQFDLDLSNDGTSVIRKKQDTTPDDDVAKLQKATVTLRQAIGTAADRAPGDEPLSAAEIDTDRGTLVWQIGFGGDDGYEVLVDATSGDVVRAGRDVG